MADDFLGDRRKALEESFFAKENARLVERVRAQWRDSAAAEALAEVTGLSNEEVLDKLISLDITADTWAAISLVPLVEVAWANGKIESQERAAILTATEANGIVPGSPSHDLLESWLTHRPDARLMAAWGEYIVDLCATLSSAEKSAVKERVIGRARKVAQSAGGFLGLGSKISAEEEVVLSQLSKAFD